MVNSFLFKTHVPSIFSFGTIIIIIIIKTTNSKKTKTNLKHVKVCVLGGFAVNIKFRPS